MITGGKKVFPKNRNEINQIKRNLLKELIDYIPEEKLDQTGKKLFQNCEIDPIDYIGEEICASRVLQCQSVEMLPR